jgi:hypothetical protein
VAGLFALALLLRLINLDSLPAGLWFDEAQNGIVAQRLLSPNGAHVTYIGDLYTQMGMLDLYFTGTVINIFGNGIWQVRLLTALSGSLAIPLLYLLASRLYGWRVGLAAAGLALVSTWHITFSRFASGPLMFTVMMDLASYLCIAQALRTGRLGFYAAGGVLLGLGLHAYYPAKYAFVVLLALLVHRIITERMRLVRALRPGLLIVALGVALAFMPVGLFAMQNWEVYNSRVNTVSIFNEFPPEQVRSAIESSVKTHMLMFNWAGDRNGRHNLPGAPILDWLTAALFFAGLASCVWRAWRWQYFFPLVWFAGNLSGGVLSLLFEAPQGARTMENSVVTALFAGIFLGELWGVLSRALAPQPRAPQPVDVVQYGAAGVPLWRRLWHRLRPPTAAQPVSAQVISPLAVTHATTLPVRAHSRTAATPQTPLTDPTLSTLPVRGKARGAPSAQPEEGETTTSKSTPRLRLRRHMVATILSIIGILAFVGWVSTMTIPRYFQEQANDRGVWKEMYVAEAEAGRILARYGTTHDVYITPIYAFLPPSKYLAPSASVIGWEGMHTIPFMPTASRDVVIMLDPPSAGDLALIARIYPNSRFEIIQSPSDPEPLAYTAFIPASDINALQGVRATVTNDGQQTSDTTVPTLEFNWSEQGVTSGTVRLSTTFRADPFGLHTFQLQTAGGSPAEAGSVMVDGYEVGAGTPITLGVGIHSVVVTDTLSPGGSGITKLLWSPPGVAPQDIPAARLLDPRKVEPRGLTGLFREGTTFTTTPVAGRLEPVISAYFHNTPWARPYTAEWKGRLYIPEAGPYTFATEQVSRSTLFLDGKELIVNFANNNLLENTTVLSQGWHDILVRYEDYEGYSHMYLYWTPPGKSRVIIPSAYLWPDMGSYPEQPESGPFPTLDEYSGINLPPDRVTGSYSPFQPVPPKTQGQPNQPPVSQPPPPQAPQMQGTPIVPLYTIGSPAPGGQPGPFAVAADTEGNTYIFSVSDSYIRKFDGSGSRVKEWPALSADSMPLTEVSAMLVQSDTLLALDAERSELLTYGLDGSLRDRRRMCECYFPRGMSASRDGNFWVSDTGGGKVLKVNAGGEVISLLGDRGSEPGKFIEPVSIWETPGGIVYVADIGNNRVQSFGPDGKPIAQWTIGISHSRDGNRLVGDGENVLVTDGESRTVTRYDSQGKELGRWSFAPSGEVLVPSGIAAMGSGRFAVLYLTNNHAIVFSP